MDLRMPIRRMPDTIAPLTTLITISTDITSPISPNATMNGTHGANDLIASAFTASQDCVPSTLPGGSAAVTSPMAADTAAAVPASEKRYSIWAAFGAPAVCSAATSDGATQPWAVPVTDVAMPTTVSLGEPGTPVTVSWDPIPACRPSWLDRTICPGPSAQWPAVSVRSSTGPPGEAPPPRVSGWHTVTGLPFLAWPAETVTTGVTCAVTATVVSGNGPVEAVTPAR